MFVADAQQELCRPEWSNTKPNAGRRTQAALQRKTSWRTEGTLQSDELLTVAEIAERLQVKESWVYRHAELLGAYRLGKYLRFSWPMVVARLEQNAAVRQS